MKIDIFFNKVLCGDVLEQMALLPKESIDCIITSPPYWQLRSYQWDGQWGLEPAFQAYLEHLWQFADECFRVLKPTGSLWVNLGDTYGTQSGNMANPVRSKESDFAGEGIHIKQPKTIHKSLLLLPHRFAIGCIDRGWVLRNDVIWSKRNAMPESVVDRFSKKHEFMFFFVKNEKYYFDLVSIKDKTITKDTIKRNRDLTTNGYDFKNPGDVSDFWDIPTKPSTKNHHALFNFALIDKPIIAGCPEKGIILDPFCGSGTTLARAKQLGRNVIGIEGKPEFVKMAQEAISVNFQLL